jgi:hypothetical protein
MAAENGSPNGGDNRLPGNLLAQAEAAIVGNFEDERLSRSNTRESAYPQRRPGLM